MRLSLVHKIAILYRPPNPGLKAHSPPTRLGSEIKQKNTNLAHIHIRLRNMKFFWRKLIHANMCKTPSHIYMILIRLGK